MMNTKKWLINGLAICLLFVAFMAVVPATFAHGLGDETLEALGITEEEYEAAKESARVSIIEEAADLGWISEEEAETLIGNGRSLRFGRGWYYAGIIDETAHLADALDISVSELESAKADAYEARLAEAVADGRLTEAEAADKQAINAFEASLDSDALLAEALGISVADLDEARSDNVTYTELLDELGMSAEEARDAQQVALETAVEDAVDNGTLTAEQAEAALEQGGCNGGRGGKRGGRGQGDNDDDAPAIEDTDNA